VAVAAVVGGVFTAGAAEGLEAGAPGAVTTAGFGAAVTAGAADFAAGEGAATGADGFAVVVAGADP
jgi:hypothetical protein